MRAQVDQRAAGTTRCGRSKNTIQPRVPLCLQGHCVGLWALALRRAGRDTGRADSRTPWAAQQACGLVCAAPADVLQALDDHAALAVAEPLWQARLRARVQNQLGDASLSVRGLALQTGCSADHLS